MILIELEYPFELLACIRTAPADSYDPYYLATIEYGRDIIDEIKKSKEFQREDPNYLHEMFSGGRTYEYDKIKERVVNVFNQKP
jgi:hypothetical protein